MVASKLVALGFRNARRRLVEQQHLRPAGEGQCDFEQPLLAIGQHRDAVEHDIGKMKALDNLDDLFGHRGFGADHPPPVGAGAEPFRDDETDRFQRREIEE